MIRVLIDECLPKQLKHWLAEIDADLEIQTIKDAGWEGMKNGILLRAANGKFDVLVTADKNMHHQQNFVGLDISVLVYPTNRAKMVKLGVSALGQSLQKIKPGQKTVMEMSLVQDWNNSVLEDVVEKNGVTHHIFRPWC
jgi:predicted nuclease of predicted toxin-antitoxin system